MAMEPLEVLDRVKSWQCPSCGHIKTTLEPANPIDEIARFALSIGWIPLAVMLTLIGPEPLPTLVWVTWVVLVSIQYWSRTVRSAWRYKQVPDAEKDLLDRLLIKCGTALEINGNSLGLAIVAVPAIYSALGNRGFVSDWIPEALIAIAAAQLIRSYSSILDK